ncbi:uncharacterized protein METZ01_LOCUS486554 [marine metagenome]|uniref:Uncharacterized protein n=1 Tax=marine metagenome TaxID=408172 RepID=A0A383CNU4_9ZZZZ
MNKEHEIVLKDEGLVLTVNVEWSLEDCSHSYEYGNIRGTRELHNSTVESFDITMVVDEETGEDRPDVNACLVQLEKDWEDEINSLLNDGKCTPEPPDTSDFQRDKDEHNAESRMENEWLKENE